MIELTPELTVASKKMADLKRNPQPSLREAIAVLRQLQSIEPRMVDADCIEPLVKALTNSAPSKSDIEEVKSVCLEGFVTQGWGNTQRGYEKVARAVLDIEKKSSVPDLNTNTKP